MPIGDFPDPKGMMWTDANGWVPESSPRFGPIITPGRIEQLIEGYKAVVADGITRTDDGILRCYYAGFNLTALAAYLSEKLNQS